MTIVATCQCGKKYQVKEELAGKRVKCPACAQPFEIPVRQVDPLGVPSSDPLGVGSGGPLGLGGAKTETNLRKRTTSAKQFSIDDVSLKKKRRSAQPNILLPLILALGCLAILLVVGLALPPIGAMLFLLLCLVAGIAGLIGNVWLIVHAFSEDDVASGVIMVSSFVFPITGLYTLYYLISRWDDSAPFWITAGALGGYLVALLYLALVLFAGA